jgi:hypothetical protein
VIVTSVLLALAAVGIALLITAGELFTKYQSYPFKELLNRYVFIYLSANAVFAYIAFILVPFLPDAIQPGGWKRALFAGFGFAFILRAKFFTVTVEKREFAIGPELIYTAFLNYVKVKMERRMRTLRDALRGRILKNFSDLDLLTEAVNILINDSEEQFHTALEARRDRILHSAVFKDVEKKYALVDLLIDLKADEQELESFLRDLTRVRR